VERFTCRVTVGRGATEVQGAGVRGRFVLAPEPNAERQRSQGCEVPGDWWNLQVLKSVPAEPVAGDALDPPLWQVM
jgi:hypothetical protein